MPREGKARVLSDTEFKRVLKVAGTDRHAARNVALLYVSFGLGLRVKEIGALSVTDVLDGEGQLRTEVNLQRRMTKGYKQRHAYLSNPRVRQALQAYLEERRRDTRRVFAPGSALFLSNKGNRFTPNALQQVFTQLYKQADLRHPADREGGGYQGGKPADGTCLGGHDRGVCGG